MHVRVSVLSIGLTHFPIWNDLWKWYEVPSWEMRERRGRIEEKVTKRRYQVGQSIREGGECKGYKTQGRQGRDERCGEERE